MEEVIGKSEFKSTMKNTTYLDTIRGQGASHIPVWFMRQAGRSQAKYREIKKGRTLFDITHDPELCAYVTALPVEEYDVDAAILYKDIMTPLQPIGVDVEIKAGIGPVISNPIRSIEDVKALRPLHVEESLPFMVKTIEILTKEMLEVPLIGFAGAPFTLASYMIEGGPSKSYQKTRQMMVGNPEVWHELMHTLSDMTITYLEGQIKAGVNAIQIFDSWVGAVSLAQYQSSILPHMYRIARTIKEAHPEIPLTLFGIGTKHLLGAWKELPIDVIGCDWRCSLTDAHQMGISQTLQGNLDSAYLMAPWDIIRGEIDRILAEGKAHGRHIFNLGHGVVPETNPDVLKRITEYVHEVTSQS